MNFDHLPRIVDTHCHLYLLKNGFSLAHQDGVGELICVGLDFDSSKKALELAEQNPRIYATVGLHPNILKNREEGETEWKKLLSLLPNDSEKIVAIGETGIDLYRSQDTEKLQIEYFRRHLELAQEFNLPVVVHNRYGARAILDVLEDFGSSTGVFHCYDGSPEILEFALSSEYYVSFAGNLTYPNSNSLQETAKRIPDDKLLVETDAPFMPPQSKRGRENLPQYIVETVKRMAEMREVEEAALRNKLLANSNRLFRIGRDSNG